MKKLYSLLIVLCLIGCSNQNKEQKKVPKGYLPSELDSIYGFYDKSQFIITEQHNEFTEPVAKLFSKEERKKRKHKVWEYTWKISADSMLTVWYIKKGEKLYPIQHYYYPSDAYF